MTEEEEKAIEEMNNWLNYNKKHKNMLLRADEIIKVQETILNLISNLQKENEELKQDNSHQWEERCKLTFEIERLQKELDKKDKVINNLYEDIEYEYSGTNYLKSLEEYYREVEDKDE